MKLTKKYIGFIFLLSAVLLVGCSGDESPNADPTGDEKEIRLNAEVWQVMEGTRATTYDNAPALQGEIEGFKCIAYDTGTATVNTTSNVNSVVKWNSLASKWEFEDGIHKWPDSGSLDFFAYMPASPDAYITDVIYAVNATLEPRPYFTCDMTQTVNKEFIYALTTGQDKEHQGSTGVTMTFKHPFARIYFQLSNVSGSHVTINSISISGEDFYKKAKCTFDGTTSTWSEKDDDTKGSLGSLSINTPYIVIPHDYGSSKTITVNATWDDWSNVTTNVTSSPLSINWVAGRSYTYTLTLSKYALKVGIDKYTEQW